MKNIEIILVLSQKNFDICKHSKDQLLAAIKGSAFYEGNYKVHRDMYKMETIPLSKFRNEVGIELIETMSAIQDFIRLNVTESKGLTLSNNITVSGNRFVPADITMGKVVRDFF